MEKHNTKILLAVAAYADAEAEAAQAFAALNSCGGHKAPNYLALADANNLAQAHADGCRSKLVRLEREAGLLPSGY